MNNLKLKKVQNGDFFYVFEKLLYSVHFNNVNLYDMTISRHFFFQYWTQLNRVILSSWKILEYYINKTMFFCREKLQTNVYSFAIWDELNKNIPKCVHLSPECPSFVGVEFLLSSTEWSSKNPNIALLSEIFSLLNYLSV